MTKKERIITSVVIVCLIVIGYFIGRVTKSPTVASEIQTLYAEKGRIVAQKPALLSQKAQVVMDLANIDYQILEVDKKLYKLLNPVLSGGNITGFIEEAVVTGFTQNQAGSSQTQAGLVK